MAAGLVDQAVNDILEKILDGVFQPLSSIPKESELADSIGVSRLTLREAVKVLRDRGVLEVVHGKGTFVADPDKWNDMSTLLEFRSRRSSPKEFGLKLLEIRCLLEAGAAELAALNHTSEDLTIMAEKLDAYDQAVSEGNILRATKEDIEFHNAVFAASKNSLIKVILQPLEKAMTHNRIMTTKDLETREKARMFHRKIRDAIASGNPVLAKNTMLAHMEQTRDSLEKL